MNLPPEAFYCYGINFLKRNGPNYRSSSAKAMTMSYQNNHHEIVNAYKSTTGELVIVMVPAVETRPTAKSSL